MGLLDRFRRKPKPGVLRGASSTDTGHLEEWAAARHGVEAFVEPKTTVTETTVVLVAHDGEWTRRRIDGEDGARKFARKLGMPIYDAGIVGYPQRMRDYTARQKLRPDNR
ncbi:oxidoreductase [Umezawaea sp. Da 62-37]|uniref:oxidoreductase n=1 Tax=Umezawaea sp. Da 62-37 TaxID=3075927 RepID=UPI0028F6EF05|nr:oxidoreductase [Umezawaea sp. Da 62-37]WNV83519.1 oxidoreductase [Umezawaea sp. Da 62-37]